MDDAQQADRALRALTKVNMTPSGGGGVDSKSGTWRGFAYTTVRIEAVVVEDPVFL
ncbi:hypothetical protein CTP10_R65290 (plasmid) [Cupriavidus sp. P-10]|uniref:hypothetical protein n=1 Tax=Cupriavidus sp. P-10 TaxID=2027911 RepID=UPI000EDB0F1E|nr:hypothetical protein [Cupriavidus sp. P-10]BDB29116.1 hypothetical protein CTP10_R65290 [Cupriavidus sp. P-10]